MKVGYARISTKEQDFQLQLDALKKCECEKIFTDKRTGKNDNRQGLKDCLASLKNGDVLFIWKLDRLFRSVVHFAAAYQDLKKRGVELVSITQSFDTRSSSGRLMMNILSSFAEFESDIISERTAAGMQAAILQGRKMGRKFKYSADDIKRDKVSKSTFYRRRKNENQNNVSK